MIDWTKPIRHAGTKEPAKLVYTMNYGSYPRLVVFTQADGKERHDTFHHETSLLENVPERHEHWANVYRDANGGFFLGHNIRHSEGEARAIISGPSEYVSTVLLYIDNPPALNPDIYANVYEREDGSFLVSNNRFPSHVEAVTEGLRLVDAGRMKRLVATIKLNA